MKLISILLVFLKLKALEIWPFVLGAIAFCGFVELTHWSILFIDPLFFNVNTHILL